MEYVLNSHENELTTSTSEEMNRRDRYLCSGGTVTRCSGIANLFLDLGVCYRGLLKLEKIYQAVFLSGHISKYILYFNKKFTKNNQLITFSFLLRLFLNLFSRMQVIS